MSAADALEAEIGPLGILVNNAGIAKLASFLELSDEDWRRQFSVNVDGVRHACWAVVPKMLERRRGVVINMSSWLGKRGMANFSAYCATKFAIIGLTQALTLEVASRERALPGLIVGTLMREQIDAQAAALRMPVAAERGAAIPLGRAGESEDVAGAAAWLASDDASYVTGTSIDVAEGLRMGFPANDHGMGSRIRRARTGSERPRQPLLPPGAATGRPEARKSVPKMDPNAPSGWPAPTAAAAATGKLVFTRPATVVYHFS